MALSRSVYLRREVLLSLSFLLLLLMPSPADAQRKASAPCPPALDWLWRSDSLHYTLGERLRLPSLLVFAPKGKPSEVGVAYSSEGFYPAPLAGIPRREDAYTLFAQGGKDAPRFALRGGALFRKRGERDLSHGLSDHSAHFYPFVIADTVVQDIKSEIYALSFDAGYRPGRLLSLGISADYEGALRYGRKDPRVQNISSVMIGRTSVSLDLGRFGILTGGTTFQKEIQPLSYSVLVPHSSQLVYVMRPLGEYNFRYSGKNDNGTYRHKYSAVLGQGVWALPTRNAMLGLSLRSTSARLETRDAGVYLSELTGRDLSVYFRTDIWSFSKSTLSLCGSYYKRAKEGEERVYRREQIDEHSSLTKPVLITSQKDYTESHSDTSAGLAWRVKLPNTISTIAVSYRERHFDAHLRSEPLFSTFGRKEISYAFDLRWKSRGGRLYGHTALEAGHLLSEHHAQGLNTEQPTYVIEEGQQLLRRGADDVYTLRQELRLPIGAEGESAIVVGAALRLHHRRDLGNVFGGSCRVAYAF